MSIFEQLAFVAVQVRERDSLRALTGATGKDIGEGIFALFALAVVFCTFVAGGVRMYSAWNENVRGRRNKGKHERRAA